MKNEIDLEKCRKCGLCAEICPVGLLEQDEAGIVRFVPERQDICLECGQCMAICPADAVRAAHYCYEKHLFDLPENTIDYAGLHNFFANRRSVRNFREKPVEPELIEKIIASIDFAPYGASPDKVETSAIVSRQVIEAALPLMEQFLDNIVKWIENPVAAFMIKYKKGIETFNTVKNHLYPMAKLENYKLKYGDRITRGARAMLIFHAPYNAEEHTVNSVIYCVYSMFAAQALGLGASMNGIVPAAVNKVAAIRKIFHIPDNHEAVIALTLGYPKYKYKKAIKRNYRKINWIN